ncbi:regulator of G protein signaling superfamily [Ceraceosorus guamensis]|uniref:Regulator of G protein signaling superfamily n=1 Tax=Ceraceosorus guamensis TaxID=1522189 RepID=A0A316W580_9BASI|nr:regulator of G protein signaling superfamily [Ceraceosorus guamensis]PWN45096.1 regulator of G protein signaling superfamily [Ceraceosorus guamensis]
MATEKQPPREGPRETPSPSGQRTLSLSSSASRKRLPTLAEVLARRTLPPVDLYCYYLFLQREGSEDSLDFWLDVQQHENLCRAYFKDLKRTGVDVRDDWPGYYREARQRGSIYNRVNGIEQRGSMDDKEEPWDQPGWEADGGELHRSGPQGFGERAPGADGQGDIGSERPQSGENQDETRSQRRSNLAKRASVAPTVLARNTAISRVDLIASAERIYARYLLPGSEKEIYLPPQLRIPHFPISSTQLPHPHDEEQQRALARVPDMFHSQKEYVFRTMEADVFPRFLRHKAFGNLTPISALVRLSLGLLALWAGLATGFSFIFLDVGHVKRLWVILPFSVAIILIMSHQYELDPFLVIAMRSETTPFHLIKVKEPYVKRLLRKRAAGVLLLVILIVAALTVIFTLVPGHRL